MVTAQRLPTATSDSQRSLPAILLNRDKPRLAQYRTALDYYQGNQWPASRTRSEPLRRLTVNYLRAITNKTASYVMQGRTVSVHPRSDSDDDTIAAAAAEDALNEIAHNNALDRLDHATEIDTAVIGDGAFKVTWQEQEQRVIITAPAMDGLYPWPHPTDPTRFLRVAHRYLIPANEAFAFYGLSTENDPAWLIEDWDDNQLRIHIDDSPQPGKTKANPYGFIPYVIFPNEQVPKQWGGESDVIPLYEVAQEYNRAVSSVSNILELSGNPIAVLEGVEQAEGIQAHPGAIWELPGAEAKAYVLDLLQHNTIGQHQQYLDTLLRTLHDISETPRTAFGDIGRQLSGVAIEMELAPLLQKVARRRLIRTDAYSTRAGMALALLDKFTGTTHLDAGAIITTWDAPTPQDRTREIGNEQAMVDGHTKSHRTAMAALGQVDPDDEWARIQEERRQLESPPDTV